MSPMETFLWYLKNVGEYTFQMLPCMCAALVFFFVLRPARKRRFVRMGLVSTPLREGALLLFIMFVAGLAALTLFPANFWSYIMNYLFCEDVRLNGFELHSLYPTREEIIAWTEQFSNLNPFQEIKRAFRGGPWVFFMMIGNIGMFVPIGFFTALLWRRARWWRSALAGCASSCLIEVTQLFIGRSTDVDDVILNTAGALMGFWLYRLLDLLFPACCSNFQCQTKEETSEWTN